MSTPCHAQHLVEARLASENLAEAVLVEGLHAVAERCHLDLAIRRPSLQSSAYRIVDDKSFSDAGPAPEPSMSAGRTSDWTAHARRRRGLDTPGKRGLQPTEQSAVWERRLGAIATKPADEAL